MQDMKQELFRKEIIIILLVNVMETKLSFENYKIISSSFSNQGKQINEGLEVEMQPKLQIQEKEKKVALSLSVKISDKDKLKLEVDGRFIFRINIGDINSVSSDKNEIIKDYTVEATKVAYLLLRSYISSYTALSGIMPIFLPIERGNLIREDLEIEEG